MSRFQLAVFCIVAFIFVWLVNWFCWPHSVNASLDPKLTNPQEVPTTIYSVRDIAGKAVRGIPAFRGTSFVGVTFPNNTNGFHEVKFESVKSCVRGCQLLQSELAAADVTASRCFCSSTDETENADDVLLQYLRTAKILLYKLERCVQRVSVFVMNWLAFGCISYIY